MPPKTFQRKMFRVKRQGEKNLRIGNLRIKKPRIKKRQATEIRIRQRRKKARIMMNMKIWVIFKVV